MTERGPYPVITSVGDALPGRLLTNEGLISVTGIASTPAWIAAHTGIEQRYWATDGRLTSDLAVEAAEGALAMGDVAPRKLSSIYISTSAPDYTSPNTASLVHDRLGASRNCESLEVRAACAGFIACLRAATDGLQARPEDESALVIGAELQSARINWHDRRSVILFGDGAGAAIVQTRPDAHRPISVMLTEPNREAIYAPAGGQAETAQGPDDPRTKLVMDGPQVKKHALSIMHDATRTVAFRAGLVDDGGLIDWQGIDLIVPHQANLRLMEELVAAMGAPAEKCITTVGQYGNTSSASIPMALAAAHREGRIGPDRKRVLFTAVGAGMVGGAILMDVELPM